MSCNNSCDCTCTNCCPVVSGENGCLNESLPLQCTHYSGADLPTVNITAADSGDEAIRKLVQAIETINSSDKFVKVSLNDSTSGYLASKIAKGTYTTVTKQNGGLNENLKIDVDINAVLAQIPVDKDEKIKVSSTDTVAGYLQNKTEGSEYILVTKVTGEKLHFALDYDALVTALNIIPDSYKFKIDNSDTTADFLTSKLLPDTSSGVIFVKNNNGANENVTIGLDIAAIHDLLGLDNINIPLALSSPTNTVVVSQGGNANHTATIDANISSVVGNQLRNNSGLYVPALIETPIGVTDSSTIDLTASGTSNHTLTATAKISGDGTNALSDNGGLYVPKIVANDSDTIDFSQSGPTNNVFSAGVKISVALGNALVNSGGLYVPGNTNNYPNSLAFDATNGNLSLGRNGLASLGTNLDGRYYPILGSRSYATINDKGWFYVPKEDVNNPFHNADPTLGLGGSGFASFEGANNGWILMGQDGLNTITGQTFDLYGALRNPSGGFYPSVRMWHSDNVTAGSGVSITQNTNGQFVISSTGGGSSVTASNGLHSSSNIFRLGGPLTEDTLISNTAFDLGLSTRKVVIGNLYSDVYGSALAVNNTRPLFVRDSVALGVEGSGAASFYHKLLLNGSSSFGSGRSYVGSDSAMLVSMSGSYNVASSAAIAAQYNVLQIENTALGILTTNPSRPVSACTASVQPSPGYSGNAGKVVHVSSFCATPIFQAAGGSNFTEITNYSGLYLAASDEVILEGTKIVNKYGINQAGPNDANLFYGNISYYGTLTNASDFRIKEDIQNYGKGLDVINSVRVVDFEYSGKYKRVGRHVGVIAQELETILPEAVKIIKNDDLEDFRTVDQSVLLFTLVNAVKALSQEINQLKAQ
jgi:hypothetical protein